MHFHAATTCEALRLSITHGPIHCKTVCMLVACEKSHNLQARALYACSKAGHYMRTTSMIQSLLSLSYACVQVATSALQQQMSILAQSLTFNDKQGKVRCLVLAPRRLSVRAEFPSNKPRKTK